MEYCSTRDKNKKLKSAEAIRLGISSDGGLFVPDNIPNINIEDLVGLNYQELSLKILELFLTDFSQDELSGFINKAYNNKKFDSEKIAPIHMIDDKAGVLELWHGPTAAFKDMALQLMPYLLTASVKKCESINEVVILVATSGDTGKAALEGFKDIPGTKIIVFYPKGGVSNIQELQMVTTAGDNTFSIGVEGNFDDCQTMVKEIFGDSEFNKIIENNGFEFSSANSINWGRLVPQIIYYFWSYVSFINNKVIKSGELIDVVVPTGNFGNILAAYYAKKMGLPIHKLICASNKNNVLTDFFDTGVYNRDREFHKTTSPSMDILISSNLERFLFSFNEDNNKIIEWYSQLKEKGQFKIDEQTLNKINAFIYADYAEEEEVYKEIKDVYKRHSYLIDPHTAVGFCVYNKYKQGRDKDIPVIIDSTASAYKFGETVYNAITKNTENYNEMDLLNKIKELSKTKIHRGLAELDKLSVRHSDVINIDEVKDKIKDVLGIT